MLKSQADRREQINKRTLLIGADIGKEFNALVLMDYKGHILEKLQRVYNSHNGYKWMMQHINQLKRKKGYRHVLLGLEPTGHYWRKFSYYAQSEGIKVVFVKTTSVKYQRGLYQSSRAKNDIKDAAVIANLIYDGKYCDTEVREDIYQVLRRIVKCRDRTRQGISRAQNRLIAWLDDYFPELMGCFSAANAKSLRALLRLYPTPGEINQVSTLELSEVLEKASRRKVQAENKARKIQDEAAKSIGIRDVEDSDKLRLHIILNDLEHFEQQRKELEKEIIRLLSTIEYGEYLLSIKGIGMITAATFLGELGDPRNFRRAKQIISYSGLDPFETESGKFFGRRRISKEGRFLLRATLYRMAISVVNHNQHFKSYYQRKLDSKNRATVKRKEILCAVAIKLVKLLFALMRDKRNYQEQVPENMLRKAA
jgi:transposase